MASRSWLCFFHCRELALREMMNMRLPYAVAETRLCGFTCTVWYTEVGSRRARRESVSSTSKQ